MTLRETVQCYFGLCKGPISFFAALSATTGFLLADDPRENTLPVLFTGVFLMACGASALNHYQDRRSDSRMPRTAGRPIPSGKIQPGDALQFSLVLIGSGAAVLLFTGVFAAPLLGLAAVLWYNGFYTWLKAHHAFTAIPGALVGAIPPAIGWTAGGGYICDVRLVAICFFFFMWQVPHFLLHQQLFGREYEAIHLPSLTAVFTVAQLDRLTFQWLLAAAASLQLVILYGLIQSFLVQISLLVASLWFATRGIALIRGRDPGYSGIFMSTNYFMLVAMLLIFIDRFPGCMGWATG
jgi:heme o synthase